MRTGETRMKATCFLLCLLACAALAPAQDDLPRHGVIGLVVTVRDKGKAPASDNPAIVQRVVEGSAAAQAGFQPGDVIRSIDGVPVTAPTQFAQAVSRAARSH